MFIPLLFLNGILIRFSFSFTRNHVLVDDLVPADPFSIFNVVW